MSDWYLLLVIDLTLALIAYLFIRNRAGNRLSSRKTIEEKTHLPEEH